MISYAYWFDIPLVCRACGTTTPGRKAALSVSRLNSEPRGDRWIQPGDNLPIYEGDFRDAFVALRPPDDSSPICALAQWSCPNCKETQWVKLEFEKLAPELHKFSGARTIELTPATVNEIHYLSDAFAEWAAANPGPETQKILDRLHLKAP